MQTKRHLLLVRMLVASNSFKGDSDDIDYKFFLDLRKSGTILEVCLQNIAYNRESCCIDPFETRSCLEICNIIDLYIDSNRHWEYFSEHTERCYYIFLANLAW